MRRLKFDEKPDYRRCRNFFADAFERLGYDHDYYYDWILKKHNLSQTKNLAGAPMPQSNVRGPLNRPKAEREIENKPPLPTKTMEDTSAHFFEKEPTTRQSTLKTHESGPGMVRANTYTDKGRPPRQASEPKYNGMHRINSFREAQNYPAMKTLIGQNQPV